ncbi:acyltransferase family protein [Pseudomonas defluvii]|nr:acyltransferase family protein [Pseudomonas defluvii]
MVGASLESPPKKIRLDVQGLRALAVLAVVLYHVDSSWLASGFVGVDVFFVISGFIITSLIYANKDNFDWKDFYWGRIKRIVPAYFLMLAVVALVSAVFFVPADFSFFIKSLKSAVKFTSNSYFEGFGSYFAPSAHELPLLHTWSLAIEMQFYLFFPFLVCFVPDRWLKAVLLLLIVSLFAWSGFTAFSGAHQSLYFSLAARIPEFLIGAVVALSIKNLDFSARIASILGVFGVLLMAGSFLFIEKQHFPGVWAFLPCLGTALVIAARRGPVSSLLSSAPMIWIGGVSYSLYLWHWPILAFIRYYTGQYELTSIWLVVFFAAAFFAAWLSYSWVETPARSGSSGRSTTLSWGAFVLGVIAIVFLSKSMNATIVEKLPVEMTRYAPADQICHGTVVGDCKRGDPLGKHTVLVLGDSHAAQLNYFFDVVGAKNAIDFRVISASSCVPITGFDVERLPEWARKSCLSQVDVANKSLAEFDTVVVAGMWQYHMPSEAFNAALTQFLKHAETLSKRVVVLAQIPMFDVDAVRANRFTQLGLPVSLPQNREWKAANSKVETIVRAFPNAVFLDLSASVFFATAPFDGGVLMYRDSHHLNEYGARRYGEYAGPYLAPLITHDR